MDLVAGAVGSIVTKLSELLHGEYKLQKGLPEQIEYLKNELKSAHMALCKVGETPPEHLDRQVRLWAGDVRESSYDMEDILDAFLVDVMEGAAPAETKSLKKKMAKLLKKSKARHDIAGAIEDMKKRLQEVWDRRNRYSIPVAVAAPATKLDPRLVDMHREAGPIIGIERTRVKLKAMLQSSTHGHGDAGASSSSNWTKIVSVVGAGGLGKTTVAKVVYDELSPGYDCRAFVSVGRNPDLVQVFTSIFFHLDQNMYQAIRDVKDLQLLIGELRKSLENKRYFIVIDDVWDKNSWQALGSALHQNNNGSRVVKTTRNLEVACGDEVYQLGPLSHDNSKKLFYMRLYGGEGKCPAHHPEEASQKILDKCGGVPLAIITMASLLVGKSREDWFKVCSSPGFYHGRDNKQVDDTVWILSLSYHDLPSRLKTCLLYLSVYPEDCWIEKDSLIWKWVAEGFIEKKAGTSLFQRGEEYFHQLINWSMIQGVEKDGSIQGCHVHDMVLDLIRDLAGEENFITISNEDGGTSSQHKVRRLAHQKRILLLDQSHPDNHRDMAQLRTLVAHGCDIRGWVLHPSLKLLRVLALERCTSSYNDEYDRRWLEHLGKLVHLRYLGLRGTMVRELPEAIGALKLLQTLDLDGFGRYGMQELPSSVSLLTRLVCLRCDPWTRVPDGFLQKVTSLEELRIFVDMQSFESKRQFLKELGNLSLLRVLGVLRMFRLDESLQAELLKSLGNLQELQHLDLFISVGMDEAALEWDKAVFPEHLRHLGIQGIWFPCLPSFINPTRLPSLSYLELYVDHIDEAGLRALGGLPDLLYLRIKPTYWMASHKEAAVVNIAAHDVFFHKLRLLNLDGWMVQLATNHDSTTASFSIWRDGQENAMVFDPRAEDGGGSRLAPAPVVMPNLHELWFIVPVRALYNDGHGTSDNLSLDMECLPSLGNVRAYLDCKDAFPEDVNKARAELRRVVQHHPNSSALRFDVYNINQHMMAGPIQSDDEKMLKRQKWRATRLRERIGHQKELHNSMKREGVKMDELITKLNISDDTKNKVQLFHQQFRATVHRVQHKLLPVEDGTPIHDRDLTRVLEDIKAMEQALEVLTVEFPRFAAMLDELRYTFSLQGAMPMPQVLNLNIRVFDIMVHKLGLKFGLLGKVSSLRVIKAHLICYYCFPTEVEEVEAELRQAVDIHHPNNPPTLKIIRYAEDRMVNSDSESEMLLERQILRRSGIVDRVNHQMDLHHTLHDKVVEIIEQETNMTLSDAAKHKMRRFLEHCKATNDRVEHELLRAKENIPNPDLKRLTEENDDAERALQILTAEYPRLAATLEELKTALSFEAEDEDEMTEEVSAANSLSGREDENEVTDEVSAASLHDREEEEEVSGASQPDKEEADVVTQDMVSAASVSETELEEPIH